MTGRGLYGSLMRRAKAARAHFRTHSNHRFEDRRQGAPTLVYMLAGYKQALWPFVMPRVDKALPAGADVCLVSSGLYSQELSELCRDRDWSYLSTSVNDVSLAQNLCLRLYDQAEMVIKLDEDIFLLPDTLTELIRFYGEVKREGVIDPGFVAPIIPLNGLCHRYLLEKVGLLKDFEAAFGKARLATDRMPITDDSNAARWIWERTTPLEATAAHLRRCGAETLLCSVRFSIGVIVFERSFWQSIGMLPVHWAKLAAGVSTLGADENFVCSQAVERSRPGLVFTGALAGHFSFGSQYEGMLSLLRANPALFEVPKHVGGLGDRPGVQFRATSDLGALVPGGG